MNFKTETSLVECDETYPLWCCF